MTDREQRIFNIGKRIGFENAANNIHHGTVNTKELLEVFMSGQVEGTMEAAKELIKEKE